MHVGMILERAATGIGDRVATQRALRDDLAPELP